MSDFIKTKELEMELKVWSGRKGLKSVNPLDTMRYLIIENDFICERLGWVGRIRDEMKGWLIDDGQLEAGINEPIPCTSMVYSLQKVFDDQSPEASFDFRGLIIGLIESYATRPLFREFNISVTTIAAMQPLFLTFDDFENGFQQIPDLTPRMFKNAVLEKAEYDKISVVNFFHILTYIFNVESLCEKIGWTKEMREITQELVEWRGSETAQSNPFSSEKPILDPKLDEAISLQSEDHPFNFAEFIVYCYKNYQDIKSLFNNLNIPLGNIAQNAHVFALKDVFNEVAEEEVDLGPKRVVELPEFSRRNYPSLTTLGVLLTDAKKHNDEFPITGREKEIEEAIECLLRMQKNSFCLIGEPGVGKSSVAYELARRIVKGTVPPMLQDRHIVEIRLLDIISGAKSAEDAAKLFKSTLDEASFGRIILFIDEIHTLVTEKTLDASNILKPYLTDKKGISVIGATTNNEYSMYIRRDGALNRRFSPLRVGEPDKAAVTTILTKARRGYERHYNMEISDEAIDAVADYSRLIMDKNNPDKSLELLEGTCANIVAGQGYYLVEDGEEDTAPQHIVRRVDIASKVCKVLGLPLGFLISENDPNYEFDNIYSKLSENIFGQDECIKAVSNQLANAFTLHDEGKPLASFLFSGPTGVGKTELANTIADVILGGRDRHLITLDMAEFTDKSSVTKLIGSPPGHGDPNALDFVDELQKKPPSVIAVEGIENAHPDIIKMFSKILDEGRLQNTKERAVNFEKTIIIFTSNLGYDAVTSAEKLKNPLKELKKIIGMDFVNRIDDIAVFNELDHASQIKIAKTEIDRLAEKFGEKGHEIRFEDSACEQIIKKASGKERTDARMIKSYIRKDVTSFIRDEIRKNSSTDKEILIKL